jgi:hypothetical protein
VRQGSADPAPASQYSLFTPTLRPPRLPGIRARSIGRTELGLKAIPSSACDAGSYAVEHAPMSRSSGKVRIPAEMTSDSGAR